MDNIDETLLNNIIGILEQHSSMVLEAHNNHRLKDDNNEEVGHYEVMNYLSYVDDIIKQTKGLKKNETKV